MDEHLLLMRFHHSTGLIWASLQIVFYYVLSNFLHYREDLIFRLTGAFLFGFFTFIPTQQKLKLWHVFFVEFALAFNLPFLFTYSMIINQVNIYWFGSMIFCGLCYGLASHPLFSALVFPSLSLLLIRAIGHDHLNEDQFHLAQMSILVSYTLLFVAIAMRLILRHTTNEISQLKFEQKKSEQLRDNFLKLQKRESTIKTYVRPSILTEIALGLDPLAYKEREVTKAVLFTDIQGFTRLAETQSTETICEILNEYFTAINEAVYENAGEVDKFMGDAAMATFDSVDDCMKAYLQVFKHLKAKRHDRIESQRPVYSFGIGLSYGTMLSANFGSVQKFDRTVIGDPVNIAARIEALTRYYNVEVIASEDFIKELPSGYQYFRAIDIKAVKGRSQPIKIYELFEHDSELLKNYKLKTKETMAQSITFKSRDEHGAADDLIVTMIQSLPQHSDAAEQDRFINYISKTKILKSGTD